MKKPLWLNKFCRTQVEGDAKPSKKRGIFSFLGRVFKRFLLALGGLVFFTIVLVCVLSWAAAKKAAILPHEFVLYLPITEDFLEHPNMAGPYNFGNRTPVISDIMAALDAGTKDQCVKGLVVNLEAQSLNIAHLQELVKAVKDFRAAGKFAYIYSNSYGDGGSGLGSYYLASAFDEIWLQPMGTVSLAGISIEMPFARGALEKLGVEPQFFARKEYKSIFETFTRNEMSPQNRKAMTVLLTDLSDQLTGGISENRKFNDEQIQSFLDQGVFLDQEAAQAGLVTKLDDFIGLRRKVSTDVTGVADNDKIFVNLMNYTGAGPVNPARQKVAMVYVVGDIVSGSIDSRASSFGGDTMASAYEISEDIIAAANEDDIKAIVVRIDSPGGSPVAAETMRLALLKAQEKGKKVIVSMGYMAASGGYWVAAPADYIFAMPGTLTGSIGVAGGKFVLEDLWRKLGINWDSISLAPHAGMWSFNRPFSEREVAIMNKTMDSIYDNFVARVASGRKMTKAQADKLARGRVWTGRQAQEVGLVDELGTLDQALDYTAKQIGLTDRHDLEVIVMPQPKTPLEMIVELLEGQVRLVDFLKVMADWGPVIKSLSILNHDSDSATRMNLSVQ